MAPILEVDHLSKRFGGVHAVEDFDLEVEEGSLTGLIGPNGAGKSTAIELITGYLKPDGGHIRFMGRDIHGLAPHRISRLGLLRSFQLAREWPALTVMENMLVAATDPKAIAMWRGAVSGRRLRRDQQVVMARCHEVLDEFGLAQLEDELAGRLSGGQKRLLEFARLVMARPRLVLLDEPLAGVNPVMGARIQAHVGGLVDHGITVLLVEHNLQIIESLCSSVVVMALGSHIAKGEMSELRSNPTVVDAYLGSNV